MSQLPLLDDELDAAIVQFLTTQREGVGVLRVAGALGLEANGGENQLNADRIEVSLRRVADRGRFGDWYARRTFTPRSPEPRFQLHFLGSVWVRCWMDRPARPSDLAREFGHKADQMRDALTLLIASGLVVLQPAKGRRHERYVTTSRDGALEYRAHQLVLDHVRTRCPDTNVEALATQLGISQDTAEALVLGLQQGAVR